jgi:hypothetical protein
MNQDDIQILETVKMAPVCVRKRRRVTHYKMVYFPVDVATGEIDIAELQHQNYLREFNAKKRGRS